MSDQEYFDEIQKAWRESKAGTCYSDDQVVITRTRRGQVLVDVHRNIPLFMRLTEYCSKAGRLTDSVSPDDRDDCIGTIYC
jgi:hypothetical protein